MPVSLMTAANADAAAAAASLTEALTAGSAGPESPGVLVSSKETDPDEGEAAVSAPAGDRV